MEELKCLRIDIPASIREKISEDSRAIGLPAYTLYRKILEDFVLKKSPERLAIYTRRRRGISQD